MHPAERTARMRIGIGLPNAVPGRPAQGIAPWARESEDLGFHSLGSIDRLLYDVLDPLVALAAAAAATERVRLVTNVLNVGWRNNAVLLAKQLASLDLLSGGRLTAGLGIGGWPQDFAAGGVPAKGHGRLFDDALLTMRRTWNGEVTGLAGPPPLPGPGRPGLLVGGMVRAGWARAARFAEGWVAPGAGRALLLDGIRGVTEEWAAAGRSGRPRILTSRYFCCGPDAANALSDHVAHYYGSKDSEYYATFRADCLDSDERLHAELTALALAGVDDVLLLPCSATLDQVGLLAEALERVGARRDPDFVFETGRAG
ncbi:LLM class flavin-dependent oxidoreductase [Streptomyces sp. I05A-00742]|uniref:LLM class flavin-dependent oxidoreductase n=1 Tax=Streptomyces sp. I05A-00742 TaxID=2732853 RepID=UPI002016B7A9|nr:LLM class flavin-dependent oxidoreductase [Streptomyces sp. I05A-00742]